MFGEWFPCLMKTKIVRFVFCLLPVLSLAALPADGQVLIPTGSVWKYLDNGSDQGTAWRAADFVDSSWASGPAQLGYGDGDEATVLSYGPDSNNKYPTTYFRHPFNVANPAAVGSLALRVMRDDGVVVYINGTEVFRNNVPDSAINYQTAAITAVGGTDESTFYTATAPADLLQTGANVVAVEIHQANGSSSDISFDLELRANAAPTVAITSPTNNAVFVVGTDIAFTATASDTDGTVVNVEFFEGASKLGESATAPYTLTWGGAEDGFHHITAVATDNDGGRGTSRPVTVLVNDPNPPALVEVIGATNQATVVFSKRVTATTATNLSNYKIDPGVTISAAQFGAGSNTVILSTSPLAVGATYTLTVNNIRDASGNMVAADSTASFQVTDFISDDIGGPAVPGTIVPSADGYVATGSGNGLSGNSDQFTFNYHQVSGDFDVKVRVAALDPVHTWAEAGLMARESLAPNSRHAASLATPSIGGCFFKYRAGTSGNTTTAGSYPANYPDTWLRLKRAGNLFSGYASSDGQNWASLGSVTVSLPATIFLGIALDSHGNESVTTRVNRLADATGSPTTSVPLPIEPPGPASRRTPLAITEIMYHPPQRADGKNLEFVEVFNSQSYFEDLSGFRLSGDIDYVFPAGTILEGGEYLVVAKVPADLQAVGGGARVLGPFTGSLPNDRGTVRLRNELDGVILEVEYDSRAPWPVSPDGAGHSLVLARPSYGQGNPRAWAASDHIGGSPGAVDGFQYDPLRPVMINEFLAHTDPPASDFIELYNHSNQSIDLSGAYLTDDPATNKFRIPNGTAIDARGFLSFDETQLGFALAGSGKEPLFLVNSNQTRVIDAVRFFAQAKGVSTGRFPDGASPFSELESPTPGAANAAVLPRDIVLNEIMYNPISGSDDDEYVELYNRGSQTVDLGGWRFTDGIDFTFPSPLPLAPGGYLVVARHLANLLPHHSNLNATNSVGDFSGSLANSGERLALSMPEVIFSTNGAAVTAATNYIVADEVTYNDGGRWGHWADGGGSSLELMDPHSDNRQPSNWADSDETGKSSWTRVEFTGVLDNGQDPANQLHMFLQGDGEALVDNVEVLNSNGANLVANGTFESGVDNWFFQGTHDTSGLETAEGENSAQSLHLRATGRGDTGANRIRTGLAATFSPGQTATLRADARWLKGDPDILLRLRGNWLEAPGRLNTPDNLGTPGAPNSRAVANAGPAIFDVSHFPVLPAANEPVVVTARAVDPDGIASINLIYNNDAISSRSISLAMRDDGTGGDAVAGDGVYSATIPGQTSGTMIDFFVNARDGATPGVSAKFPENAPARQALVRFGETIVPGSLGTYRIWFTSAVRARWEQREKNSNEPLPATFVYGNFRAIYTAETLYSGSPWHTPGYSGPMGGICDYVLHFMPDDPFLGAEDFVLASLGNLNNDPTAQAEQASFWIARQLGVPYNHRRYIHLFVNGLARGLLYEDAQQPNSEMIDTYFPNHTDGQLHKIEDWFEFDDSGDNKSFNVDATLQNFTTPTPTEFAGNTNKKMARYRWNWRPRAVQESPNDFANLFALVDAVNAPSPEPYTSQTLAVADIDEWMRVFALERIVGNWDSYGYNRGKNMYAYLPPGQRWRLLLWDIDFDLGSGGDGPTTPFFGSNAPLISRMYQHPPFVRRFWNAMSEAVNGPLLSANFDRLVDAKYQALLDNGVAVTNPTLEKNYVRDRRNYILSQLPNAAFAITSHNGNDFSTDNNLVNLAGTAPVQVYAIRVNGKSYPVTWNTVTGWTLLVPLNSASNLLTLEGVDLDGNPISNASASVTITYTGTPASPADRLVINEIMADPTVPGASYVELYNSDPGFAFDLAGYRLNGLGYRFRDGAVIAPGQYLLLVKNRTAFSSVYGSGVNVFDEFPGNLQTDGETLSLIKSGSTPAEDVVVDAVKYENQAPWPSGSGTRDNALQLVDPARDNSRVSNWATSSEWRQATSSGIANSSKLYVYLGAQGEVYIDDLQLVAGDVPEVGPNLLLNGGFESPLDIGWTVPTENGASEISPTIVHSGSGALHLVSTNSAVNLTTIFIQYIDLPLTNGQPYALSYWYRPTTNDLDLTIRLASSTINSTHSILPVTFTPGAPNSVQGALPAYPPLWINEVLPENLDSLQDNAGQRDPWIELYNSGSAPIALDGLFLTDNYSNLTAWPFPAGASIAPSQFLLVWADGQPAQSTSTELHTSFRLNPGSGSLALAGPNGDQPLILDYINYQNLTPGRSYGSFPDGQLFKRQVFAQLTPGAPNNGSGPAAVQVFINEWMAANTATLADPADGAFDDWLELYNAGDNAVDLSNWFLTDDLGAPELWRIPTGASIAPHGFLLVWADNQPEQNGFNNPLHAGFQLAREGESIGLADPDGLLVDSVSFGAQTNDVSQGRFPDGAPGPYVQMNAPTPGAPNITSEGGLLRLGGVTRVSATELSFTVGTEAGRAYRVEYKNNLEDPVWTPLGLDHVATGNTLSLTVPMDAGPQRFYRIVQLD